MKKFLSVFIGLLIVFSFQPLALSKNLNSNHEQDLEAWKESITECVKDQNKDGFWIDVAIDESGSMATEDPQNKALEATYGLIEELSLKVDKFNNLEKEIYFNFYPFSTGITSAYSTGKPATKSELESISPNSWTYTGGGTTFDIVFYYFLKNSKSGIQNPTWSQNAPLPPTYSVNSKDLNLLFYRSYLHDFQIY